MLDQLLLRSEDQELWRQSATSLRYLVLDEFHTYDGAQGTDVAMLLRRLGLALKSHWRDDDPLVDDAARSRPLGLMTPVATSATLGDKGDPSVMREFAHTVFGERFDSTSVVTETRLVLADWADGAAEAVATAGFTPRSLDELRAAGIRPLPEVSLDASGAEAAYAVLGLLYGVTSDELAGSAPETLSALCRAHPLVIELARSAGQAIALSDLALQVFGPQAEPEQAEASLSQVLAMLGHVRKVVGGGALSVDVHLWVRELTRIDRAAAATARFRWSDDGPVVAGDEAEEARPSFPAIFCRHCGRSGWGSGSPRWATAWHRTTRASVGSMPPGRAGSGPCCTRRPRPPSNPTASRRSRAWCGSRCAAGSCWARSTWTIRICVTGGSCRC